MTFRFEVYGEQSSPFSMISIFQDFPYHAIRLASMSAQMVNNLEPPSTACILYESARKVEHGSAIHLTYPWSYGLREFDFLHSNVPEADVNRVLMSFVSGRKKTIIATDSELHRFADGSFDAIVVVLDSQIEPATASVTATRQQKLKAEGGIYHVRRSDC